MRKREHCETAAQQLASACLLALASVLQPLATKFHRSRRDPSGLRGDACDALRHGYANKINCKTLQNGAHQRRPKGCHPSPRARPPTKYPLVRAIWEYRTHRRRHAKQHQLPPS